MKREMYRSYNDVLFLQMPIQCDIFYQDLGYIWEIF